MQVSAQDSKHYFPTFLGGRGLAAKIAWDEYPQPVDPFDERNPLMIFPGALTGTRSPYSGRTMVCSFSPQAYPHHWFTRSSVGGWIGGNIKRAGYDGIIVTGKADEPVRILVLDDEVSILPADDLWGVDALDTLEALSKLNGKKLHSLGHRSRRREPQPHCHYPSGYQLSLWSGRIRHRNGGKESQVDNRSGHS